MTSQHLDKRLSRIAAKVPEKPNPRAQAAFKAIITYLDGLAARKAAGDPDVQKEIEGVSEFMKRNTLPQKIKSKCWDYEKLAQKNF
mgnify:CR=1